MLLCGPYELTVVTEALLKIAIKSTVLGRVDIFVKATECSTAMRGVMLFVKKRSLLLYVHQPANCAYLNL